MASYLTPGIYIEEKKAGVQPIEGVSTSVAAFVGVTTKGPVNKARLITSMAEFVRVFGGPIPVVQGSAEHYVYYAVRHFFMEGGTKCYVVRTVNYTDVNDLGTIQATRSARAFTARQVDGTTAVNNAFTVSAMDEGAWGQGLSVKVENASRFSLLLAENVPAGAVTQVTLRDNADVVVGSVLLFMEQVTGVVRTVNIANNEITFRPGFTAETASFSFAIPNDALMFTPDMKLITQTDLSGSVNVQTGNESPVIKLDTVRKVSGAPPGDPLKPGDIVNFRRGALAMGVVKKIDEKPLPGGEKGMVVELAAAITGPFNMEQTRVYARDFDILVVENGELAETHAHLSLVDNHPRDYIGDRLAAGSGASGLIVAKETTAGGVVADNASLGALTPGNDGLTGFGDDDLIGSPATATGLYALDLVKDASILVVPACSSVVALGARAYCEGRKDMFFVMDVPRGADPAAAAAYVSNKASSYAAAYYPWIYDDDPVTGKPLLLPPSGAVAGSYAQTDITRGVHKAPAGIDNGYLNSATGIERIVTKGETDTLYQQKVNVIRKFPEGILIWGARTLATEPAWRYVNVRRLFIFLERSIERGLQWVVFEPNDYGLWKSIKRNVSAFLRVQWEEDKLVGTTEEKAFFVRCDETTNTAATINVGQVIAEIGVAPSKPAEFVVFRFKQFAGKAA